jgi:hypothetical protein
MQVCDDLTRFERFCAGEPIRYRHLLHRVQALYPRLDREIEGAFGPGRPAIFCSSDEGPGLVACMVGRKMQLEGEIKPELRAELGTWLCEQSPLAISTTSVAVKEWLAETLTIAPDGWRVSDEYTVTNEDFAPHITRPVRRLRPGDEAMWRRFVSEHAGELAVWADLQASQQAFGLMAKGLPVTLYVTDYEDEITGMLIVRPLTAQCDEVWTMFVDQEHRRRGNAHSMLSEAAYEILGRGRLPGYSAPVDRDDLVDMLRALGFLQIARRWSVHLG